MPENQINNPREQNQTAVLKRTVVLHLKRLAFIYLALLLVFLALNYAANKLPAPYHKRDIPMEITPWLK